VIELDLPPLPGQPLRFTVGEPTVRTGDPDGEDTVELDGRISLGGPVATHLTAKDVADDADLRLFVEREAAEAVYHRAHMYLTFEPAAASAPRLESTSVDIRLTATGAARQPVAWSMAPLRVADTTQVTTSLSLGPELKLFEVAATAGSVQRTRTEERDEIFLEALRPLRANPSWLFLRTDRRELRGAHLLVMVVRAPVGTPTEMAVRVTGTARHRRLFSYWASLPRPLRLSVPL
jgi:hypothetical protein